MTPEFWQGLLGIAAGSVLILFWQYLLYRRDERRAQAASDAYWAHNATIPVAQRMGLFSPNLGGHRHFNSYRERDRHERASRAGVE